MTSRVPPEPRRERPRRRWRGCALHVWRVGLLATVMCLIHEQHRWHQAQQAGHDAAAVSLPQIRRFYPRAAEFSAWDPAHGGRTVIDEDGDTLGYFVQTSPTSDAIVGYSGPTNTLIAFDGDGRVVGVDILSSGDTPEHVDDVLRNDAFMTALVGSSWEKAAQLPGVDAVSGATLTSLAIAESISHRLGGTKPSLRFPEEISVSELGPLFPEADRLHPRPTQPSVVDVFDASGRRLGAALRTSPTADDEIGYQGPTDSLIVLGANDRVIGVRIRTSYDNEPYVRYVREDDYFVRDFEGLSLQELAQWDPVQAEVEGVSGATMTSMAIAHGLPQAAQSALPSRRAIVFTTRDLGTIGVLGLALIVGSTHLRRRRRLRIAWQVVLVVYLGLLNGDIVSQALLVGWAQSGAPWRLAPGLVLLTAAAVTVPVFSKRQLYCHHICPFGAAQQLIRRRLPWRVRLPRWFSRWLVMLPALLLLLVVATAILRLPISLANIEPFDAFSYRVAGAATLAVALGGLVAASFIPMAYCRFGCPTGAMLDYLRFSAHSERFTRRDLVAVALLTSTVVLGWCA